METYSYRWGDEITDFTSLKFHPTDVKSSDNCAIIKLYHQDADMSKSSDPKVYHSIYTLGLNQNADSYWLDQSPRLMLFPMNLKYEVQQVAAGHKHVLVLCKSLRDNLHEDNSILFAAGSGHFGELGIGKRIDWIPELVRIDFSFENVNDSIQYISAGNYCSAIVSKFGNAYTYGSGGYYRLGHGNDKDCLVPTIVVDLMEVGDQLANCTGVSRIEIGNFHMVAISKGVHDLYGWGWNKYGQIGNTTKGQVVMKPIRIEELDNCELIGDSIPTLISCGSRHTAIVTHNAQKVLIMGYFGRQSQSYDDVEDNEKESKPRVILDLSVTTSISNSSRDTVVCSSGTDFISCSIVDEVLRSNHDSELSTLLIPHITYMESFMWGLNVLVSTPKLSNTISCAK